MSNEAVKPTKEIKKEEPLKKEETVLIDPTANPDRKLERLARVYSWPILQLDRAA